MPSHSISFPLRTLILPWDSTFSISSDLRWFSLSHGWKWKSSRPALESASPKPYTALVRLAFLLSRQQAILLRVWMLLLMLLSDLAYSPYTSARILAFWGWQLAYVSYYSLHLSLTLQISSKFFYSPHLVSSCMWSAIIVSFALFYILHFGKSSLKTYHILRYLMCMLLFL